MPDRPPNFVLVPYEEARAPPPAKRIGLLERIRALIAGPGAAVADVPTRPRLVFGFDATASREPAWAAARTVTDALVRALPGQLDVALAVHGGSRLHTFTDFTSDARTLRDLAAGVICQAGMTRLLAILRASLRKPGVRVVVYIGDVFEESLRSGQMLTDAMGLRGVRLIVLHDTSDPSARRDAEIFGDLARRTGGCVLPFDALAPDKLRDLLAAIATFAVGGTALLQEKRREMPGAVMLLEHLKGR
ncbi:MAG TPA: hypothetical protein VLI93_16170 [Acetobacteraceae bacterium]|nr:hypothetical protein [Acetobacteraceae bacterium]